jgi:hypothetical protein
MHLGFQKPDLGIDYLNSTLFNNIGRNYKDPVSALISALETVTISENKDCD